MHMSEIEVTETGFMFLHIKFSRLLLVFCLLSIVFSLLVRFTDSDYDFDIFELLFLLLITDLLLGISLWNKDGSDSVWIRLWCTFSNQIIYLYWLLLLVFRRMLERVRCDDFALIVNDVQTWRVLNSSKGYVYKWIITKM